MGQVQMYKDCFKLMDINKDGTLDKNDLRGAFDNVGVLMSEAELDDLLGEVGGPCNFQGMVDMFQNKMAGDGNDPDDLCSERLEVPATSREWLTCSRTRWLEMATIPMISARRGWRSLQLPGNG